MTGMERRDQILTSLSNSTVPISGSELARQYEVSRQVIVQDIAVIRAAGYDIFSTNKGYLLKQKTVHKRIIKLIPNDERIEEELTTIVDLGGRIEDIFIYHNIYGKLQAKLSIHSRRDIKLFLQDYESNTASPVKTITVGTHYHTIQADTEETLDLIEASLRQKHLIL